MASNYPIRLVGGDTLDVTPGDLVLYRTQRMVSFQKGKGHLPNIAVVGNLQHARSVLWLDISRKLTTADVIKKDETTFRDSIQEIYVGIDDICNALNQKYNEMYPGISRHTEWISTLEKPYTKSLRKIRSY